MDAGPSSAARVARTSASAPGVSLWMHTESKSMAMSWPSTVRTLPSTQARSTLAATLSGSSGCGRRVKTMEPLAS